MKNRYSTKICIIMSSLLSLILGNSLAAAQDASLNQAGKTIIKRVSKDKIYNTTFMIVSKAGTVVVADPYRMPDGITPDIITITHGHFDHNDDAFVFGNKCKRSIYKPETFTVKDVKVTSIASSHSGNEIAKDNPSNVIYLFEVDGLRITHLGDIGQDQFTEEQLKILGKIDIAFMQIENSYSAMSLENQKALKLMAQLNPQIIIPTHATAEGIKKMGEAIGALETVNKVLAIDQNDLKDGKRKVVVLTNN